MRKEIKRLLVAVVVVLKGRHELPRGWWLWSHIKFPEIPVGVDPKGVGTRVVRVSVPDHPLPAELAGVWLSFGHAQHGLTLGPASGRLVAEMMSGETPFCDPAPYRAGRFLAD